MKVIGLIWHLADSDSSENVVQSWISNFNSGQILEIFYESFLTRRLHFLRKEKLPESFVEKLLQIYRLTQFSEDPNNSKKNRFVSSKNKFEVQQLKNIKSESQYFTILI